LQSTGGMKTLRWFVFPALLAGVIACTVALLARHLPAPAVSGVVVLGALAAILALERLCPLHGAWNRRPEGLDLVLLVVNRGVDVAVTAGVIALLAGIQRAGLPLHRLAVWPSGAPLVVQALLGITLAEAVRYLLHRLSHRPGLLGRVHVTHHQPARMYALNGPRLHPLNFAWIALANSAPMLLLGAPLPALVLAVVLTTFFVLFQHSNVDLPFAGWNLLLATPDVHRRHHRRDSPPRGVNYGIVLLLFDHLFGTYAPAGPPPGPADIGQAVAPTAIS
jgi:sterol desaturase/sphingolipid hydroxylase (fatty acid hydroxylase superfamily)